MELTTIYFNELGDGNTRNTKRAQMYVLTSRLFKIIRQAINDNISVFLKKANPTHSQIEKIIDQAYIRLDKMNFDQLSELSQQYDIHLNAVDLAKNILNLRK